ncbi:hypothetical protein ACVDG5_036730 [Mesorhizobium sp. ORM6]
MKRICRTLCSGGLELTPGSRLRTLEFVDEFDGRSTCLASKGNEIMKKSLLSALGLAFALAVLMPILGA